MDNAHNVMRATRGAAMAAARIDFVRDEVRFAGIGNIGACVYDDDGMRRQLVSHNGIVGNNMRKVQEFTVPCEAGRFVHPALGRPVHAVVAGVLSRSAGAPSSPDRQRC